MDDIPYGYARVTEVLKPFTKLELVDSEVLAKACEIGSKVHEYCENYVLGLFLGDIDEECKGFFNSFKNWYDEYVEKFFTSEERLIDKELRLTGKFDMILKIKGDLEAQCMIDLKTPESHSKTWDLQMGAYDYLMEKTFGQKTERSAILRLKKDGSSPKFHEYSSNDRENNKNLFLQALKVYRKFNP